MDMKNFKRKWQLIIRSIFFVFILIVARIIIDHFNLDIIAVNPIISSLITGVIFTIAVIFTGTLTDYKESEKIPGELAASIKSLYSDSFLFPTVNPALINQYKEHIRAFHHQVVQNFKTNKWDLDALHGATTLINQDLSELARENVAPPILVKMRIELTTIDKISNRIKQIKDTDFIPAAYAISELSITFVIIILLFIKSDAVIESIILLSAIAAMIIGLLFLIRDMDDPFEFGNESSADVDLFLIFDLERFLKD